MKSVRKNWRGRLVVVGHPYRDPLGDLEILHPAARPFRAPVHALERPRNPVEGREVVEDHSVRQLARELQHLRPHAGEEDRNVAVDRLLEAEAPARDRAPLVAGLLSREELSHELRRLPDPRERLLERHPVPVLHHRVGRGAEPEGEPPGGDPVDGEARRRDDGRNPRVHGGDPRAEPRPLRPARDGGREGHRVAHPVAIGEPEIVEAFPIRPEGALESAVSIGGGAEVEAESVQRWVLQGNAVSVRSPGDRVR